MARLSKKQIAAHVEAETLLDKVVLTDDEREFVLDHWQESANHVNSAAGAFFTPSGLAESAAIYTSGAETILDLCAGIGGLGLAAWWHSCCRAAVTCVEINPAYVEVGRKVLPEATWICASADALPDIGRFDCVIANPPFGKTAKLKGPRYSETDELAAVDIASRLARWGVFILPAGSLPFEYSGVPEYRARPNAKYDRFHAKTGLTIACESVGCEMFRKQWRGVAPRVEVVSCEFDQAPAVADMPLFERAA